MCAMHTHIHTLCMHMYAHTHTSCMHTNMHKEIQLREPCLVTDTFAGALRMQKEGSSSKFTYK